MRNKLNFLLAVIAAVLLTGMNTGCNAAPKNKEAVSTVKAPQTVPDVMEVIQRVNNHWQTENPEPGNSFWHWAAYQTGNMAAYDITGEAAYKEYALAWAEKNEWKGSKSNNKAEWKYSYGETDEYVLFGDWQICFQTYIDLYNMDGGEAKIARAREVMEYQMSTKANDYWWWADGLYMVMPVMTKLYNVTKNDKYLVKLDEYFAFAKDLMYDKESCLFYRDAKYIYPKHQTQSGLKDFWARGNGWVFAGLTKVITDYPKGDIRVAEYVKVFQELANSIAGSMQPEGYWTRSMLDPEQASGYETSGTAFFAYGILWGLNNGYLENEKYLPVVEKAWEYLTTVALQPDGTVGYVQPIGERADQHKNIGPETTADFGVGAFLLASTEMVKYLRNQQN